MLVVSCTILAVICSVSAAPRERRADPYFGFPFTFAYTRPYGGFASAAAGGGFPLFYPQPMMFNPFYFPTFDFPQMTPWYKGPNVCETKKVSEEPSELKEFMNEGFDSGNVDFKSSSQSCRGNNEKHICIRRIQTNDGSKVEVTKYECCYGFVRTTDGSPGCVESDSEDQKSVTPSTGLTQMKMKDEYKYTFYKDNLKDKSGVENVPVQ